MKIVTFEQFIKDYNAKYNTRYGYIFTNTLEIDDIISDIYDCYYCDINFDDEIIELY